MNVLDENIPEGQRARLRRHGVVIRQIGSEVGQKGLSDEDIIPLLRRLRRPTFFTRDEDFHRKELRHTRYCLVWLNVRPKEVAEFVRRVLRHPEFNTQAKRMGTVIGASSSALSVWRPDQETIQRIPWPPKRRK